MKYIKSIYIGLVGMLMAACQTEQWEAPQGGLCITLAEDVSISTKSTPAELGKPTAEKFTLNIVKESTGESLYSGVYTSQPIPASTGTYTVTATYGTDYAIALDSPYYKGEAAGVEVEVNQSTPVTLTCKVANALASIVYGEGQINKFDELFSTYGVEVKVGNSSVTIGRNGSTTQSAYYRAGSTPTFTFKGTLKENSQNVSMEITSDELTTDAFQAGQHCKFTLSLEPATAGAIITVEKVEVETVTISETIPVEWLPKPKVNGFNDGQTSLTYTETDNAIPAQLTFTGSQAIQDVEFSFDFQDTQEKFQALNHKTFVLSQLSEEDRNLLDAASIILPNLDGTNSGQFDFTTMTSSLQTLAGGTEAVNTIKVRVKANNRWSSEEPTIYEIRTIKPEFTVNAYPGNIWTKEFTMNALMKEQVTSGDYSKLSTSMTYQYSTNGIEWIDLGEDLRQTGLTPETTYYIRGLYRGEIASEVAEVKTYPIIELENGNMESWSYTDGPQASWPDKGPFWKRWYINQNTNDNEEGWCSLNGLTTSDNDPKAYVSNSGTERTTDCYSGNYAAEIKTIGWGDGTTAASPISSIKQITPGELFLGKMNNTTPIYGKTYKSKPTKLRFYYKYLPEGEHSFKVRISLSKGNVIIAANEFNGNRSDEYTEQILDFIYKPENITEEIQTLSIQFVSGDNEKSEVDKASVRRGSRHVGNKLYIDDISLIYDK